MIQFNVFPGGKRRIVTFSFDDGQPNDKRLAELFRKYGVKGTFHLNGRMYRNMTSEELAQRAAWYEGHEISSHMFDHPNPPIMTSVATVNQIMKDRAMLEKIAGYPVYGMSYPYGLYTGETMQVMRDCGIVYSRTTQAYKNRFPLPTDFLTWHPSCKFDEAEPVIADFLSRNDSMRHPLLYIWGHSYELRTEADWERMEALVASVAGRDDTWYATNMEIYRYVMACRSLIYTVDEKTFYNPTDRDVWLEVDKKVVVVPAGSTVNI